MSVFHNINRYAIGFDHLMDHLVTLHSNNNLTANEYPPYDIIKEGENNYKVELAVAGFKKYNITVFDDDTDEIFHINTEDQKRNKKST